MLKPIQFFLEPTQNSYQQKMSFIGTEPCILCKYRDWVVVCPMDCFVEGLNFLAIDPAGCIDCPVCVAECPVGAIVNAAEATEAQELYIELNARLARDRRWKPITSKKSPLEQHDKWKRLRARYPSMEAKPLKATRSESLKFLAQNFTILRESPRRGTKSMFFSRDVTVRLTFSVARTATEN